MESRRIFVAIDISDDAREQAASYIDKLKAEYPDTRVRWEKPEKLHLTLKFVGSVVKQQLADIQNIVEAVARIQKSLKIRIGGTGAFVRRRRQAVLWLGVEVDSEPYMQNDLEQIAARLNARLGEVGVEVSSRDLKPHLTIARIKEPEKAERLVQDHLNSDFPPVEFKASAIVVYESKLLPSGSAYSVISKHPFSTRDV